MSLIMPMRVTADTGSAVTNLDKVSAAERRVGAEARAASSQMIAGANTSRAATRDLLSTVTDLKEGMFRVTAAFGVTAVITQFTRGIVDSSNKMQGWRQSFNAATASITKGAAELEFARQEADRLGISLDSSTYSFAKLTAATRGTILAGEATREIFTSISEASRVLNLGAEQTTGAFRAIEQMISKGTVQAEELRGQLAERIPGAFHLTAQAIGVTTEQLNGMLERGEVLATDMVPKFAAELKKLYSGPAAEAANTPAASFARLGNAILELQVAIGDAGFMKILADGAIELTDSLRDLVDSGYLSSIANGLMAIGKLAVLVFAGKAVGAIGAYVGSVATGITATVALSREESVLATATANSTTAMVAATQQRIAKIAAEEADIAVMIELVAAQTAIDKQTMKPQLITSTAQYTLALEERRLATERLATAEARLAPLTAEGAALAKLRAVAEAQLTVALAEQKAAQAALIAPISNTQAVMNKLGAAGSALFTALGGWVTVAIAAAYAIYSLWTALESGGAIAEKVVSDNNRMIESNQAQLDSIRQLNKGVEQSFVDKAVSYEKAAHAIAVYEAHLQVAKETEVEWYEVSVIGAAKLAFLNYEQERLTNGIAEMTASMEAAIASELQVAAAQQDHGVALGRVVDQYMKSGVPFDQMYARLEQLGLAAQYLNSIWREAPAALAAGQAAYSESTNKFLASTYSQINAMGKSRAEMVALEAAEAELAATTDIERIAIGKAAEALIAAIKADEKRQASLKITNKSTKDAVKAAEEFVSSLEETVNGYRLTEVAKLRLEATTLKLTVAQRAEVEALLKLKELYDATADAVRDAESAFESLVSGNKDLDEIIQQNKEQLAGLSEAQIQANAAMREANKLMEQAMALGPNAKAVMEEYAKTLKKIGELSNQKVAIKEMDRLADAAEEAAERSKDAWENFTGGLAQAIVEGGGSVKKFWKQLLDDLKRQLIQSGLLKLFGSMFNTGGAGAQSSILSSIMGAGGGSGAGGFMSTAGQVAGGNNGGIFGSLLGGGGGATSSLGSIASALPGLLAIGGIVAGFQNPGNSGLATAGRVGAYGVGGLVAGTVAAGALTGGAAGLAAAGAFGAVGAGFGAAGGIGAGATAGMTAAGATSGAAGAAAAIPVVGWIIAAIAAIDMISGGRVFGTKYRPEKSNQSIAINDAGGTATASMTEVRQRSLFRGRSWRTTSIPASAEAREAATQLFDSVKNTMIDASRRLEVEVPPVIDAAIRTVTEYDKKGKVKTSQIFVDILGRSFKEADPEKAGMRIIAESIIAVLAKSVEDNATLAKPAIDASIGKIFALNDDNMLGGGSRGGGESGSPAVQHMNEVHNIAERWRKDAEMLLEGAQFLLMAQEQIVQGNNLLGAGGTLTGITDLVEELQRGEETLSQTFGRLLAATDLLELALDEVGISIDKTGADFVRFASDFVDAAGGLEAAAALWQDYLGQFFNIEEQAANALESAQEFKERLMTNLGLDPDITAAQFREQFEAALPTLEPEEVVRWLEASRALLGVDRALATIAQQAYQLAQFTQSIADAVFDQEATDFERAMMQIRRSTASYITDANALARARGQEGASARDLALIHRWASNEFKRAIAQLEDSIRNLVDQLGYGPLATIEAQIAALEASMNTGGGQIDSIQDVGQATEDLFAQWEAGILSLQDYVDGLLVGELSPLSSEERLAEARRQLDEALAAANNGNIEALNAIPGLADQFFRQLQGWEASGTDYSGIVQQYIDQMNALGGNPYSPLTPGGSSVPTTTSLVPSEELIALYAERDRITTEAEAAHRLALAMDLAARLSELVRNNGETLFEAAERLGVNFTQLVADLGGNVTASTAEQIATLGDVANMLSIELPELADHIGLALGELTDTQSLLNDAFELQLLGLPTEFRDLLEPLFRDVENASSPEETNAALDALNEATNDLPEELRLALAPYLAGVDPITPDLADELDYLSDMWDELRISNVLLEWIKNELVISNGGLIPKNGETSPNSVNAKLMFAGDLLNTVKSATAEANSAMVYEMQQMRAEQERMRAELKTALERLGDTNERATREGADKVASSVDDIKRNGIVTRTG